MIGSHQFMEKTPEENKKHTQTTPTWMSQEVSKWLVSGL